MRIRHVIKDELTAVYSATAAHWKLVGSTLLASIVLIALGVYAFYDLYYKERVEVVYIDTVEELFGEIPELEQYGVVSCQLTLSVDSGTRGAVGPSLVELWGVVELSHNGATWLRERFNWKPELSFDIDYYTKSDVPAGVDLLKSVEFKSMLDRETKSWMVYFVHIEADPSSTWLYLTLGKG
jgi:hypothetical protein